MVNVYNFRVAACYIKLAADHMTLLKFLILFIHYSWHYSKIHESILHFLSQHRYDQIVEWWRKLADDNLDLVKFVESIGKSVEGRDQPAVHITASVEPDVKKIYFQCQIHAST